MSLLQNINGALQEYQKLDRNKTIKRSEDVQSSQKSESIDDTKQATESIKDTVSISVDSQNMLEKEREVNKYLQELEQLKSIDEKQLSKIKTRLESGYYSEPAVVAKVIHELMVTASLPQNDIFAIDTPIKSEAAQKTVSNDVNLEAIREKIQNNEYNSDQVMSTVANKILGIE